MPYDVSIVLISWSPTGHRLKVLTRSLASLQSCTQRPHVLVVVDNGPAAQTDWLRGQRIDIHVTPGVNLGIGSARNLGADQTDTEFIAFVDSDIAYCNGWLTEAIHCLQSYPDRKLIAAPSRSGPLKLVKHRIGSLDGYQLFNRASGQCLVMRRTDYEGLGRWSLSSVPGGDFCFAARNQGYQFIHHPSWTVRHLCKNASYDYRQILVDGVWVPKPQESK